MSPSASPSAGVSPPASLAATLGAFVASLDVSALPEEVNDKAHACLLNGYGIGLGCHPTPYAPVAREAVMAVDGGGPATLLADGRKVSLAGAMLANSALFHGRAQEDACGAAHLGAIVIPMLTAMLESGRYDQANVIPALVAGYEAGGLFEETYAVDTTPVGFRASTLYGPIAAAAAAARLMGLSADRCAAALANAASFAGGLLQSFVDGTDEWRYQVGVSGQVGLTAATLAAAGSVSAPGAFEGPKGLVRAYARRDCDTAALAAKLGRDWQTMRVAFKPFPVCAFNQTPVTAALELRQKIGIPETVRVYMNPYECGYAGMDAKGPFNSISGTLMSIPFCIALALVRGTPTMALMTRYDDPEVNALESRIELVADTSVPVLSCRLEATVDGNMVTHEKPMTAADYSYSWDEVSRMVRRIGAEEGVPAAAYDGIERFCAAPGREPVSLVVEAFQSIPAVAHRGAALSVEA
ncbi:MmgE/PrpD family protein [Acuticoccus sediminis]|uniref:MmgE/PrpD family protein n=1 Tax=Acuticoccus sediminis TaxID=2184697 RepID=UPI001CFDFAF3|nr:MmgE/PrpD family protein [Acuticoccus sediminis]